MDMTMAMRLWTVTTHRRRKKAPYAAVVFVLIMTAFVLSLVGLSTNSSLHLIESSNPVSQALRKFGKDNKDARGIQDLYPNDDVLPNPPLSDGYDTFSACLLVMDDNHRLMEWMAYHYHVLPLRTIIVAVDPRSKTSPTSIFNKWRKQGVYIKEWTDKDFWRSDLQDIADGAVLQQKRDRHRGRQKFFYRSCLLELQNMNRTWVSLHDSDEYMVYNHPGGDDAVFHNWQDKQQARLDERNRNGEHLTLMKPSITPPTTAEVGGMLKYIRQEQAAGLKYYQSPCIGVPRLMFGADESTVNERNRNIPAGIDTDNLDTIRWRKHSKRNDFVKNALGKVLIDVSRVNMAKTPYFESLHRPIKSICTAPWHNDWESGLRINHYLGSWESYSFRDDARRGGERSREQWEYKATTNSEGTDDIIRPWVSGFVETHGLAKAQQLLHGAGLPPNYRPHGKGWELLPEKLDKILSTNETKANDNKMVAFDAWVREKYRGAKGNS